MIQLYSWSNKQAQIENAVQLGFSINFFNFFDITLCNFLTLLVIFWWWTVIQILCPKGQIKGEHFQHKNPIGHYGLLKMSIWIDSQYQNKLEKTKSKNRMVQKLTRTEILTTEVSKSKGVRISLKSDWSLIFF